MNNIDEIIEMLDWENSNEVQEKGISLAKGVKCISAFLQPDGKNLWDNCAKIIYNRTDEELRPYLPRLFEWVQDLNWPGALIIMERLRIFIKDDVFAAVMDDARRYARAIHNEPWINTLDEISNN